MPRHPLTTWREVASGPVLSVWSCGCYRIEEYKDTGICILSHTTRGWIGETRTRRLAYWLAAGHKDETAKEATSRA